MNILYIQGYLTDWIKLMKVIGACVAVILLALFGCDNNEADDPNVTLTGEAAQEDRIEERVVSLDTGQVEFSSSVLLRSGSHYSESQIMAQWPNDIVPKDIVLTAEQHYRVTLIWDDRTYPSRMKGKYGGRSPVLSRIQTLEGNIVYDGGYCPLHGIKAPRTDIPLERVGTDSRRDEVRVYEELERVRAFPYGRTTLPTDRVDWAVDTRETAREFVCSECRRARAAFIATRGK